MGPRAYARGVVRRRGKCGRGRARPDCHLHRWGRLHPTTGLSHGGHWLQTLGRSHSSSDRFSRTRVSERRDRPDGPPSGRRYRRTGHVGRPRSAGPHDVPVRWGCRDRSGSDLFGRGPEDRVQPTARTRFPSRSRRSRPSGASGPSLARGRGVGGGLRPSLATRAQPRRPWRRCSSQDLRPFTARRSGRTRCGSIPISRHRSPGDWTCPAPQ